MALLGYLLARLYVAIKRRSVASSTELSPFLREQAQKQFTVANVIKSALGSIGARLFRMFFASAARGYAAMQDAHRQHVERTLVTRIAQHPQIRSALGDNVRQVRSEGFQIEMMEREFTPVEALEHDKRRGKLEMRDAAEKRRAKGKTSKKKKDAQVEQEEEETEMLTVMRSLSMTAYQGSHGHGMLTAQTALPLTPARLDEFQEYAAALGNQTGTGPIQVKELPRLRILQLSLETDDGRVIDLRTEEEKRDAERDSAEGMILFDLDDIFGPGSGSGSSAASSAFSRATYSQSSSSSSSSSSGHRKIIDAEYREIDDDKSKQRK
jgi:hypothetical protein